MKGMHTYIMNFFYFLPDCSNNLERSHYVKNEHAVCIVVLVVHHTCHHIDLCECQLSIKIIDIVCVCSCDSRVRSAVAIRDECNTG